jgi:hypothetical protein
MAILDKASDLIGAALDPVLDSFQTQEDCNAALGEIRTQIAILERDLQRARLIRDELGAKLSALPKAATIESGKVA